MKLSKYDAERAARVKAPFAAPVTWEARSRRSRPPICSVAPRSFASADSAAFFAVPKRPRFIERIEEKTKIPRFECAKVEPERLNYLPIANNFHQMFAARCDRRDSNRPVFRCHYGRHFINLNWIGWDRIAARRVNESLFAGCWFVRRSDADWS